MENKKVVAIIQAHMSSSRLPGKIMKDLCGMPALYRMIERVRHCKNIDEIVVATSKMECDDELVDICAEWGVPTFRGSNNDVLARFWGTAQAYPADTYVRLTSDCPAVDFEAIDNAIEFYWEHEYKFVGPVMATHVDGCESYEVFSGELLKETYENAVEGYEREHVTPYMFTKQESWYRIPSDMDGSAYGVTLDTPEDYALIKAVYEALYQPGNNFKTADVVAFLDAHPEVLAINSEIVRKAYTVCSYDNFDE